MVHSEAQASNIFRFYAWTVHFVVKEKNYFISNFSHDPYVVCCFIFFESQEERRHLRRELSANAPECITTTANACKNMLTGPWTSYGFGCDLVIGNVTFRICRNV